jgi:hypothetical protein
MTFDPRNLLHLCKSLHRTQPIGASSETIARTVVSRAYYSAFLYAREYLRTHPRYHVHLTNTGDDHLIVENTIKTRIDRQLGDSFRTLRENRGMADYDLRNPATCRGGGRRRLTFDQNAQNDNILLAEFIINSLP